MRGQPQGVPGGESDPGAVVCDLESVPTRSVRQLVRGLLADHTGVTVEDAVLVVDELVSNACRHGRAPRLCRLLLIDHGGRLRVEVDDSSPDEPRIRTRDRTGGRGLILVDRLASRWGTDHYEDHKTVWAELLLRGPGQGGTVPHLAPAPTWPA